MNIRFGIVAKIIKIYFKILGVIYRDVYKRHTLILLNKWTYFVEFCPFDLNVLENNNIIFEKKVTSLSNPFKRKSYLPLSLSLKSIIFSAGVDIQPMSIQRIISIFLVCLFVFVFVFLFFNFL